MTTANFPQSRCRFGLASDDITPPVGIYHRMWGAAKHDRASGVHQPLRGTVLAFAPLAGEDPSQLLVAIDHCILGTQELSQILEAITKKTGLSAQQIVVVCSHTHAAGLLSLDRVDLPGGDLIPKYLASLAETLAGLAVLSLEQMQTASITYGAGHCDLAANRDFWDEASHQYVCGYNPTEPADDTLLVAKVEDDKGATLATIINYACHPTTLAWDNTLISPDFPGAMREVIETATKAPCVFLQGASGELGPREGFSGDVKLAERNGRQLGYAALSVLNSFPASGQTYEYAGPVVSGATIGTWTYRPMTEEELGPLADWKIKPIEMPIPYRADLPTLEEIQSDLDQLETQEVEAEANNDHSAAINFRALAERRRREFARRQALPAGEMYPYQSAIWRIGDAIWLTVQGEPYSLLQTELRKRFPNVPLIVASIGFSWGVSYLPPKETYGLGLYQEKIAVLAPGSLEKIIHHLSDQISLVLNPS